jgi:hypothetical protein
VTGSILQTILSPAALNLIQVQNIPVASPSTYGVAPVGSAMGVNAFVTNGNPNGQATMANSSPVVLPSDATPLNMNLVAFTVSPMNVTSATPLTVNLLGGGNAGGATNGNIIAWTVTPVFNVTNTVIALGPTPGIVGIHQLGGVDCAIASVPTTPVAATAWLTVFDTAPHASGTDVTLGTTNPKYFVAVPMTQVQQTIVPEPAPGMDFAKGISIAFTQGAFKSATAVGVNLHCSIRYN